MKQEQLLTDHMLAIEIYICHLGKTFEEACEELGLDISEQLSLRQSFEHQPFEHQQSF